ncbi:MAG: O-methyltransferase [Anaerolineae bacterium]|nr:O-methyltransferase [Anaerolineae bacterium]
MSQTPAARTLPAYLDSLVPPRPIEMQHMEAYAAETGFPIVGPASGYFCYSIAKMIGAKKIFELGSGYGYSTAWFAKAVKENGGDIVHHVVWDAELSRLAQEHLTKLGLNNLIRYTVGEAVEALKQTEGQFDLIFNDIHKETYPESLAVIDEKLRPGGILLIDNMLWSGRIFDDSDQSPATQGVRKFTDMITKNENWTANLIPIRDGLIMAQKRK